MYGPSRAVRCLTEQQLGTGNLIWPKSGMGTTIPKDGRVEISLQCDLHTYKSIKRQQCIHTRKNTPPKHTHIHTHARAPRHTFFIHSFFSLSVSACLILPAVSLSLLFLSSCFPFLSFLLSIFLSFLFSFLSVKKYFLLSISS